MNCSKNEINQIINSAVNNAMARRSNNQLDDLVDLSQEEVSNISGGLSIAPGEHYPVDFDDYYPKKPGRPIRPIHPPILNPHDPLIVGIVIPPDWNKTH
jgi:hypothetical protein